jgi:hypothetical protein
MSFRRTHVGLVAASALVLACADTPTAPAPLTPADGSVAAARGGNGHRPVVDLTAAINQTIGTTAIVGTANITRLTQAAGGGLLASGVITGTANGVAFTQAFTDLPVGLASGAEASDGDEITTMSHESGGCGVLFLDLGPLNLDVLGLVVDLAPVVLDISAVPGPGNLLGNLLCAVVGLLDPLAFIGQLSNLLDSINAILDRF